MILHTPCAFSVFAHFSIFFARFLLWNFIREDVSASFWISAWIYYVDTETNTSCASCEVRKLHSTKQIVQQTFLKSSLHFTEYFPRNSMFVSYLVFYTLESKPNRSNLVRACRVYPSFWYWNFPNRKLKLFKFNNYANTFIQLYRRLFQVLM